jgi:AP-1-like factor
MTSTRNPLQNLILTPQQQSLLFAALNSNRPTSGASNTGLSLSPMQFEGSPVQGTDGLSSFQGSPDFDYDYDFAGGDSSFDFSFDDTNRPKMIGDLPGSKKGSQSESADGDSPEKRSHPDDGEDSGAKRREGEERVAKKPGRKPLTTEPSSVGSRDIDLISQPELMLTPRQKRKAQNRAAQRAFRERKEKHLKDLETKVQELEKQSQAANSEKEALRAKVEKMTIELNEYKKRLSLLASGRPAPQGPTAPFGSLFINNLNDVNFQFEFPKFGSLPGPPVNDTRKPSTTPSQPQKQNSIGHRSPSENSQDGVSPGNSSSYRESRTVSPEYSGSYSRINNGHGSTASAESHYNQGGAASTSSPSASSNSNMGGPSSSCGTSPEPFTQSPLGFKPIDTLSTIGEEQPSLSNQSQDAGHFANGGLDDFAQWLPQTDFQFDPQVFGGYRDPQENILSNGFDDFFNDALDVDFVTPFNLPVTSPVPPKKDLIAQIDAAKEDYHDHISTPGQVLDCNKVWYVRSSLICFSYSLINSLTGRKYQIARRPKAATLTWKASALTYKRRPSAMAPAQWLARRISIKP